MEQNNLNDIILKTMNAINYNPPVKLKSLIKEFQTKINETKNLLLDANKIDLKNNNGFIVDIEIINNICNIVLEEKIEYKDILLSSRNNDLNITYGKQISNIGTACIVSDGNPYAILELILKNLLVNNSIIISYSGYMYATNTYIIELLKQILTINGLDSNMINEYIAEEYSTLLSNSTSIDLVICIGPKELQTNIASLSKNKTILSGYENFEIYIDSLEHIDFIDKLLKENKNITAYLNSSLDYDNDNTILVSDEEEAISMINSTGSRYSTSIFTNDNIIASKFLTEIKSKQVLVNTSPTIEHFLDIKMNDLYLEKTIIYPISNKTDGTRTEINV